MRNIAKGFLTIAALMFSMSAGAQAPAPTTAVFDGTYVGVSREVFFNNPNQRGRCFGVSGVPIPLVITNGVVRQPGGSWEGGVGPQGAVVMHASDGTRFEGQIDSHGTISGRTAGPICSVSSVWRKQSR
jgi:hypothetical protein